MFARFGRSRPRASGTVGVPATPTPDADTFDADDRDPIETSETGALAPLPEQPIVLAQGPKTAVKPARTGVVISARRGRSLLPSLPVPRVPKRAIFAVGIFAGLTGPAVARHLATQALTATLGPGKRPTRANGTWESATVEIIRVTSSSNDAGRVSETVGKLLEQIRR
jgi:hypothetical protein